MKQALLLAAAALGCSVRAAELFAPSLNERTLDPQGSYAMPGRTPPSPKVLRVGGIANHVEWWRTRQVGGPGEAHFVIAFREPMPVGTLVALGPRRVSYLKPDGEADATKDGQWLAAPYPGSKDDALRVVPLPLGVTTKAIRLSGRLTPDNTGRFQAALGFATAFAARLVNVAPLADVFVSSSGPKDQGFRPDARLNDPERLNDGSIEHRNWSSGKRPEPLSADKPEWIVLDWREPRALRGCAAFMGASESGFAEMLVQRYTKEGKPDGSGPAAWETIGTMRARRPWRPIVWDAWCDFGQTVTTRALRFLATAGMTKELAASGEGANPTAVSLGEILVFEDLADRPAPERLERKDAVPPGVVPITFTMPQAGKATIQILNEQGDVVENVAAGQSFPAGQNTVWWDLRTIDDYWPPYQRPTPHFREQPPDVPTVAPPGRYRWRGLWHPGLSLHYLYSYYPLKKHGLAWITADTTGGWLADHVPPQTVVRTGDTMWLGTFCEAGHALLEADLDMKKLWGSGRIWLACPRALAVDGDSIYYVEQGGWVKEKVVMIQVNRKTKQSRRLLGRDLAKDEACDIQGLAVLGGRAWLADRAKGKILVLDLSKNLAARPAGFNWDIAWKLLDHEQMTVVKEIPLAKPGRIRPYDDQHLAAVSGTRVVLIHRDTAEVKPVVTGLTNPLGLGIDGQGRFYVGEMDPVHQVKAFDRDGRLLRTLGKPGEHRVGSFDPDNLESPSAVAVDATGNVWVCELNPHLKRTSVWDASGHCINQVLGPPVYGGGGSIDPEDADHLFYHGREFRRDPKTGEVQLTHLMWRGDDERYDRFFAGAPHNFGGQAPSYPFRRNRKLFFASWQGWAGGATTTLFVYDRDHVRPVAAVGTIPGWLRERLGQGKADPRFGRKVLERTDPQIDFSWGGSPGQGVSADRFAVRWTGRILVPRDGAWRFHTTSDDGVRLNVAGKRLIDNWTDHGSTVDTGAAELKAGRHDLALEFYESSGGAQIRLEWEGPGVARQVVPKEALRASDKPDAPQGLTGTYWHGGYEEALFAWTDRNGDGRVQPPEAKTGKITFNGKLWERVGATWQFRMNDRFQVAVSDSHYGQEGIAFFRVERLTREGYPVYRLPTEFHVIPRCSHAADAVFTDRAGNAISLGHYIVGMSPEGKLLWRFRNRWPGLHAGHHTTASGDEPGVVIAPTRFFGFGFVNDEAGDVVCINSNLGATYLFTADGLYVDRAFQDVRRGLAWTMNAPPSDAIMSQLSLGDEHFGGTFQRVSSPLPPGEGRVRDPETGASHRFLYVVGQPHCSVVELRGLEGIHRLRGEEFTVTREHYLAAERLRQQRAYAKARPQRYTVRRLKGITVDGKPDDWPQERFGDGFALGFDPALSVLYVLFEGRDDRAVFQNAATADHFLECFKTGDVIDVMLQTKVGLDPERTDAAEGDIRLSFTLVGGQPAAVLYDYVVPGTPKDARLPFASPWRTLWIDRVVRLADAKVAVARQGDRLVLEAAVPLGSIHLDPKATPTIRGDVGRVLSDQTGTRSVARQYWSNQNTALVADVPSEARLQPNLWGTLVFEGVR